MVGTENTKGCDWYEHSEGEMMRTLAGAQNSTCVVEYSFHGHYHNSKHFRCVGRYLMETRYDYH